MLLLRDEDLQKVLTMPMTLEALDETQKEIIKGNAASMGRIDVYLPCERPESYYRWVLMTGGSKRDGFVVARMLSDIVSWPGEKGNRRENKLCIQPGTCSGILIMFNARDEMPMAFINDGFLGYVAGQPDEKAIIPQRPPRRKILKTPSLAGVTSEKVSSGKRCCLT